MNWATEPFVIKDKNLVIRPFEAEDFDAISEALYDLNGFYSRFWAVDSHKKIRQMLSTLKASHENGQSNPFVYLVENEVAGISRFHNIDSNCKSLEIGGTWIANKWKRSFVNTRVKFNLLRHAFDNLNAERVEFRVNSKNYVSQMAVLRIGAQFEGRLRRRQIHPNTDSTDGHVYSIIKPEWPRVEERLLALLARRPLPVEFLPFEMESQRLKLKIYSLQDAGSFLRMIGPDRNELRDSFPQTALLSSIEEVQAYFTERAHQAYRGHSFFYGVWSKDTGHQIGQLQVKNIDWRIRSADLGYFVESTSRQKGYATEIVKKGLAELNFRKFNRTFVRILEDNTISKRFARKMGFEFEGLQRYSFLSGNDQLRSVEFYSRGPSSRTA